MTTRRSGETGLPGPLPSEWMILDKSGNAFFNNQIAREAPKGHPLWREPFRSVARFTATDDVIIELSPKISGRWAIVHVTHSVQTDPRWPTMKSFQTWEGLVAAAERTAADWRGAPTKFVLTVDGSRFDDFDGFAREFSSLLTDWTWNQNLEAFNEILSGGFGTPVDGFVLRWRHSVRSRNALGWPETIKFVERKLERCHPTNRERVQADLEAAKRHEGQTLFELIVDIIERHGLGGEESDSGVDLELM